MPPTLTPLISCEPHTGEIYHKTNIHTETELWTQISIFGFSFFTFTVMDVGHIGFKLAQVKKKNPH